MNTSPLAIAASIWAVVFIASIVGLLIGTRLPEELRSADSRGVVTVSMAMVSTLTALVLGLLLSVANTSFNDNQKQMMLTASDLLRLDHLFRFYGQETDPARTLLKQYVKAMQADLFPPEGRAYNVENEETLDIIAEVESRAAELSPGSDTQRWIKPQILEVVEKIIEQHFALVRNELNTIPNALIGLLVLWLVLLFCSYALYAPLNSTTLVFLLLSSAAASGAILMIVELETPDSGFIRITDAPLQRAIQVLERHSEQQ